MRAQRLDQLEDNIRRIPGVQAATVIGAEEPSEIHIVAESTRSPKQLVRDIQSLASAGFGFAIDHRIVSIVRLEDADAPQTRRSSDHAPGGPVQAPAPVPEVPVAAQPAASQPAASQPPASQPASAPVGSSPDADPVRVGTKPPSDVIVINEPDDRDVGATGQGGARPILDQMIFGLKDGGTWAKVALRWPDGTVTQGVSAAGEAREVRARAAGAAFLKALQPYLSSRGATLEIEQLLIHKSGTRELVLVRAMFSDKGALTPLAGSAIIHDDVSTATVHALLHASNRKLISLSA